MHDKYYTFPEYKVIIFSYVVIRKLGWWGVYLVIVHKFKHVQCKYFPDIENSEGRLFCVWINTVCVPSEEHNI